MTDTHLADPHNGRVSSTPPSRDDGDPTDLCDLHATVADLREQISAKDDFLRLAAHELRRPLSVVSTALQLLEVEGESLPKGARTTTLAMAKARVTDMDALIERILQTARLDDGHPSLNVTAFDGALLARECAERVQPLLASGQSLVVEDGPAAVARGDRERTALILDNLLHNAIKYSPKGGVIRCIVRSVGGTVQWAIVDQGLGIEAANLPVLFSRFGRIRDDRAASIHGIGLGLFLSRAFAEAQGGSLHVESRYGSGSCFTLRLPAVGEGSSDH